MFEDPQSQITACGDRVAILSGAFGDRERHGQAATTANRVFQARIFAILGGIDSGELTEFLAERGIVIQGSGTIRLVTHLDIGESDIERVVAAFKAYLTR